MKLKYILKTALKVPAGFVLRIRTGNIFSPNPANLKRQIGKFCRYLDSIVQ